MPELFLACVGCRHVVAVSYDAAEHAQGLVNLDEHRTCGTCGGQRVETERDPDCTHILLPGDERCECSAATKRRSLRAAP